MRKFVTALVLLLGLAVSAVAQTMPRPTLDFWARQWMFSPNGAPPAPYQFSRATGGYAVGPTGLLTQFPANVLRHDYDPVTGNYLGVLMEGQSANLLLQSQALQTSPWSAGNATITGNAALGPDGTQTAALITSSGVNGSALQTLSVSPTNTYAVSGFFSPAATDWVRLILWDGTANGVLGYANVRTCTPGSLSALGTWSAASLAVTTQIVTNGCRVWFAANTPNTTAGRVDINPTSADATAGASGNSIYAWGIQVEPQSAAASSYIRTTTAALSRAADVFTVPTSAAVNGQPWFNSAQGTLLQVASVTNPIPLTNYGVASLSDGSAANTIRNYYYYGGSGGLPGQQESVAVIDVGGVQTIVATGPGVTLSQFNKAAFSWKAGAQTLYTNGVLSGPVTVSPIASGITTLNIGSVEAGGFPLFGHVQRVAYWPYALSSIALQEITR